MRIGILTLPLHTNYGGILQAYALQTVLERMGHEVVVIECEKKRMPMLPLWKCPVAYTYRFLKKLFVDSNTVIRREEVRAKEEPLICEKVQDFIDRYIHLFRVKSLEEVKETDFQGLVVGSDQIWRPHYFVSMIDSNLENAFLKFASGWTVTRIAYAASFGVDYWEFPQEKMDTFSKLAQQFELITVRETSGVELCKKYLKVPAMQVLDPTMLLNKCDYVNIIENSITQVSPGNLFCYILDANSEKKELIKRIAHERQLTTFYINSEVNNRKISLEERKLKSVETWLRGFYDAEFVVTDSFHACVFSIIFGKPFIAIGNVGRGLSRFQSLLDIFGLASHLIIDKMQYNPDCDYKVSESVQRKLLELQKQSAELLLKQIKKKCQI